MDNVIVDNCPIPGSFLIDKERAIWVSFEFSADDHPIWSHRCPRRRNNAWENMHTPDHLVASREPLTLMGSLICNGCGLHGFIKEGAWVSV